MRYALLLTCLLAACWDLPATAPRPVGPELTCTSTIKPVTFHQVHAWDTVSVVNRYTVPHREADTVWMAATATAPAMYFAVIHPGRCTTLYDSLVMFSAVKPRL